MKLSINRKKLLVLSIIVVVIVTIVLFFYERSYYNFNVVFTSDVHAKVDEYLGYARLSSLIKNLEKKDHRKPLVFDCGDAFSGSAEVILTEGKYIVDILNVVRYSAIGIGSHDFSYSTPALKKIISHLPFPVINTNVLNEKGDHEFRSSLIIPYRINLFKTVNIGVISLITPNTAEENIFSNVKGLEFSSSIELIQKEVNELKTQADFIILLSHLDTQYQAFSSRIEKSGFYLDKVLSDVEGIDIAIAGHVHFSSHHNTLINGVPVFFAGEHLKYIGVLNIKKEPFKKWGISLTDVEYESNKDKIEQDPDIVNLIEDLKSKFDDTYGSVIGTSAKEIPLIYSRIRQEQTDLGRYLADILKKDKDVDFSLINAGAIRGGIKKGNLTETDAILVLPFKDKLVSAEISGKEFKDILERSYSFYPNIFSGFLQLSSNVTLKVDLNRNPYKRILDIKISGEKLDKNKKYKVLLPDFLKEGGDGYDIFKNKKIIKEFGYVYEDLKNYIQQNSPIFLH